MKAIARSPAIPVDTLISYGGPTRALPDDFTKNPRFKTFINVWGSMDQTQLSAEVGMGGTIGPQDLSGAGIKTINIEILNAGHFDFWYSEDKLAKETNLNRRIINIRASDFLQRLTIAAGDDLDLFLDQFKDFKRKDGTYVIDLAALG